MSTPGRDSVQNAWSAFGDFVGTWLPTAQNTLINQRTRAGQLRATAPPAPPPAPTPTPSPTPTPTSPPSGGGGLTGNRAIGQAMAAKEGWGSGVQWRALDELWTRESGWNNLIRNPTSGAFGIAQALGHGLAHTAARVRVQYPDGTSAVVTVNEYPSLYANQGKAQTQILWGLRYIKERYGDPVTAWAHEQRYSWY